VVWRKSIFYPSHKMRGACAHDEKSYCGVTITVAG
jgi:hypothetical protein